MRALRTVALLMPLAVLASGCLIETTVDANGGGTIKATYKIAKDQTLDQQKRSFTSETMSVTKADLAKDNTVTIEAKYSDIAKLSSAPMFKNVVLAVTSDDKAGTKTITAKQVNRAPAKLPPSVLDYFGNEFTFTATLPGEVVKSNGTAKGNTVTWALTLTKILGDKEVPFEVTYKVAAADKAEAGTAAATPGATAAKKKK
jgi:hypothetical protein